MLLIGRPEAAGSAAENPAGRGQAGLLKRFLRLTFFGHFYQILALFTAPRVILDLIMTISIDFWHF